MPWYFNVNPTVIRAKLVDGRTQSFMPRTPIYISRDSISGEISSLIKRGILAFRGDDPRDVVVSVSTKPDIQKVERAHEVMPEPAVIPPLTRFMSTSSGTHESYDKVLSSSEERAESADEQPSDLQKDEESDGKKRRRRRE